MLVAREERRLAAIVSADVVGYSRLMGVDETGTLSALRAHRAELIDPKIAEHGGRIVKTMGDGLLLEFPSVVNATRCAIEIQQAMAARNVGGDEDRRILFRIGINLGDIIIEGEDIFGDGVNIAARLQEIAEPGGVSISARVYEDVRDRLDTVFHDAGEQELKNIARPIQVWRWSEPETSAAAVRETAGNDPLPLPDKPSIAVLPFDNMSDDPGQEYFSDGISEDIITGLSKIQWLFVIARNSSFTYKGQPVDVKNVGRDLGVQYVLEGSVRRGGNRVRVTAQLIEAESGRHVWADRYDGDLDNIFELQDEITAKILSAIGPELTMAEVGRTSHKRAHDFTAWDRYLQALPFAHEITKVGFDRAVSILENSIKLDPKFSNAYAMLCYCYALAAYHGWTPKVRDAIRQSIEHGDKAVALDPQNPMAQENLGWA